jgi:hypothetical protein
LTPEVKETISQMGELKYITAPDIEHHISLGEWHKAYPNAKIIGPEGLPEKRAKQKNEDVPFATVFTKANRGTVKVDDEFDREFNYEYMPSHMNKEIAFCHKPSKTLIEADVFFNLPATEQFSKSGEAANAGILTKLFIFLNNTNGNTLAQKRFIWHVLSASDRKGFASSISKIDGWDFDTVVPCHGDVIETGGKGVFQRVFQWHIDLANQEGKKQV